MFKFPLKKVISVNISFIFLVSNIAWAAPSQATSNKIQETSRQQLATQRKSIFSNKKANIESIKQQRQDFFDKKSQLHPQAQEKQEQAQAQQVVIPEGMDKITKLTELNIPQEIGHIVEAYDARKDTGHTTQDTNANPKSKTQNPNDKLAENALTGECANGRTGFKDNTLIVHIQDLHTQPQAQMNLAKIIEHLQENYGVLVVGTEGAVSEVDTSMLSKFPQKEIRNLTARTLLNAGVLTGEEYASITKYPGLKIQGIEDLDTYAENVVGFSECVEKSGASTRIINQVQEVLEQLKPKMYTKRLKELDTKEVEYKSGKLSPEEYLDYLLANNAKHSRGFNLGNSEQRTDALTNYPNVAKLSRIIEQEKQVNEAKVRIEAQEILKALSSRISQMKDKEAMGILSGKVEMFQRGSLSPPAFYGFLKRFSENKLTDIKQTYPNFSLFTDYINAFATLEAAKLYRELGALKEEVQNNLFTKDEQRQLRDLAKKAEFLKGFFNLQISNDDYEYYTSVTSNQSPVTRNQKSVTGSQLPVTSSPFSIYVFKEFIEKWAPKYKLTYFVDYNKEFIDNRLAEVEDFYKVVKQRDDYMVEKTLAAINKVSKDTGHRTQDTSENAKPKITILIAGGFHTKGITQQFREKGYSYLVVSPQTDGDMDYDRYHKLLKGQMPSPQEILDSVTYTGLKVGEGFDTGAEKVQKIIGKKSGGKHNRAPGAFFKTLGTTLLIVILLTLVMQCAGTSATVDFSNLNGAGVDTTSISTLAEAVKNAPIAADGVMLPDTAAANAVQAHIDSLADIIRNLPGGTVDGMAETATQMGLGDSPVVAELLGSDTLKQAAQNIVPAVTDSAVVDTAAAAVQDTAAAAVNTTIPVPDNKTFGISNFLLSNIIVLGYIGTFLAAEAIYAKGNYSFGLTPKFRKIFKASIYPAALILVGSLEGLFLGPRGSFAMLLGTSAENLFIKYTPTMLILSAILILSGTKVLNSGKEKLQKDFVDEGMITFTTGFVPGAVALVYLAKDFSIEEPFLAVLFSPFMLSVISYAVIGLTLVKFVCTRDFIKWVGSNAIPKGLVKHSPNIEEGVNSLVLQKDVAETAQELGLSAEQKNILEEAVLLLNIGELYPGDLDLERKAELEKIINYENKKAGIEKIDIAAAIEQTLKGVRPTASIDEIKNDIVSMLQIKIGGKQAGIVKYEQDISRLFVSNEDRDAILAIAAPELYTLERIKKMHIKASPEALFLIAAQANITRFDILAAEMVLPDRHFVNTKTLGLLHSVIRVTRVLHQKSEQGEKPIDTLTNYVLPKMMPQEKIDPRAIRAVVKSYHLGPELARYFQKEMLKLCNSSSIIPDSNLQYVDKIRSQAASVFGVEYFQNIFDSIYMQHKYATQLKSKRKVVHEMEQALLRYASKRKSGDFAQQQTVVFSSMLTCGIPKYEKWARDFLSSKTFKKARIMPVIKERLTGLLTLKPAALEELNRQMIEGPVQIKAKMDGTIEQRHVYFNELKKRVVDSNDYCQVLVQTRDAEGKVHTERIELPASSYKAEKKNIASYIATLISVRGMLEGAAEAGIIADYNGKPMGTRGLIRSVKRVLRRDFGITEAFMTCGSKIKFVNHALEADEQETASEENIKIDYSKGEAIGFDVGGTFIKVAVKRDGEYIYKEMFKVEDIRSEGKTIADFIEETTKQLGLKFKTVFTENPIYITIPGPIKTDGNIYQITNLEKEVPGTKKALTKLKSRDKSKVFGNDANLAALYQIVQDENLQDADAIVNTLGTGTGLAVLENGRLLKGLMEAHIRSIYSKYAKRHPVLKMRGDLESYTNACLDPDNLGFVIWRTQELAQEYGVELPQNFTAETVGKWLVDKKADSAEYKLARRVYNELGENLSQLYKEIARIRGKNKWTVILTGGMAKPGTIDAVIEGAQKALVGSGIEINFVVREESDWQGAFGACEQSIQAQQIAPVEGRTIDTEKDAAIKNALTTIDNFVNTVKETKTVHPDRKGSPFEVTYTLEPESTRRLLVVAQQLTYDLWDMDKEGLADVAHNVPGRIIDRLITGGGSRLEFFAGTVSLKETLNQQGFEALAESLSEIRNDYYEWREGKLAGDKQAGSQRSGDVGVRGAVEEKRLNDYLDSQYALGNVKKRLAFPKGVMEVDANAFDIEIAKYKDVLSDKINKDHRVRWKLLRLRLAGFFDKAWDKEEIFITRKNGDKLAETTMKLEKEFRVRTVEGMFRNTGNKAAYALETGIIYVDPLFEKEAMEEALEYLKICMDINSGGAVYIADRAFPSGSEKMYTDKFETMAQFKKWAESGKREVGAYLDAVHVYACRKLGKDPYAGKDNKAGMPAAWKNGGFDIFKDACGDKLPEGFMQLVNSVDITGIVKAGGKVQAILREEGVHNKGKVWFVGNMALVEPVSKNVTSNDVVILSKEITDILIEGVWKTPDVSLCLKKAGVVICLIDESRLEHKNAKEMDKYKNIIKSNPSCPIVLMNLSSDNPVLQAANGHEVEYRFDNTYDFSVIFRPKRIWDENTAKVEDALRTIEADIKEIRKDAIKTGVDQKLIYGSNSQNKCQEVLDNINELFGLMHNLDSEKFSNTGRTAYILLNMRSVLADANYETANTYMLGEVQVNELETLFKGLNISYYEWKNAQNPNRPVRSAAGVFVRSTEPDLKNRTREFVKRFTKKFDAEIAGVLVEFKLADSVDNIPASVLNKFRKTLEYFRKADGFYMSFVFDRVLFEGNDEPTDAARDESVYAFKRLEEALKHLKGEENIIYAEAMMKLLSDIRVRAYNREKLSNLPLIMWDDNIAAYYLKVNKAGKVLSMNKERETKVIITQSKRGKLVLKGSEHPNLLKIIDELNADWTKQDYPKGKRPSDSGYDIGDDATGPLGIMGITGPMGSAIEAMRTGADTEHKEFTVEELQGDRDLKKSTLYNEKNDLLALGIIKEAYNEDGSLKKTETGAQVYEWVMKFTKAEIDALPESLREMLSGGRVTGDVEALGSQLREIYKNLRSVGDGVDYKNKDQEQADAPLNLSAATKTGLFLLGAGFLFHIIMFAFTLFTPVGSYTSSSDLFFSTGKFISVIGAGTSLKFVRGWQTVIDFIICFLGLVLFANTTNTTPDNSLQTDDNNTESISSGGAAVLAWIFVLLHLSFVYLLVSGPEMNYLFSHTGSGEVVAASMGTAEAFAAFIAVVGGGLLLNIFALSRIKHAYLKISRSLGHIRELSGILKKFNADMAKIMKKNPEAKVDIHKVINDTEADIAVIESALEAVKSCDTVNDDGQDYGEALKFLLTAEASVEADKAHAALERLNSCFETVNSALGDGTYEMNTLTISEMRRFHAFETLVIRGTYGLGTNEIGCITLADASEYSGIFAKQFEVFKEQFAGWKSTQLVLHNKNTKDDTVDRPSVKDAQQDPEDKIISPKLQQLLDIAQDRVDKIRPILEIIRESGLKSEKSDKFYFIETKAKIEGFKSLFDMSVKCGKYISDLYRCCEKIGKSAPVKASGNQRLFVIRGVLGGVQLVYQEKWGDKFYKSEIDEMEHQLNCIKQGIDLLSGSNQIKDDKAAEESPFVASFEAPRPIAVPKDAVEVNIDLGGAFLHIASASSVTLNLKGTVADLIDALCKQHGIDRADIRQVYCSVHGTDKGFFSAEEWQELELSKLYKDGEGTLNIRIIPTFEAVIKHAGKKGRVFKTTAPEEGLIPEFMRGVDFTDENGNPVLAVRVAYIGQGAVDPVNNLTTVEKGDKARVATSQYWDALLEQIAENNIDLAVVNTGEEEKRHTSLSEVANYAIAFHEFGASAGAQSQISGLTRVDRTGHFYADKSNLKFNKTHDAKNYAILRNYAYLVDAFRLWLVFYQQRNNDKKVFNFADAAEWIKEYFNNNGSINTMATLYPRFYEYRVNGEWVSFDRFCESSDMADHFNIFEEYFARIPKRPLKISNSDKSNKYVRSVAETLEKIINNFEAKPIRPEDLDRSKAVPVEDFMKGVAKGKEASFEADTPKDSGQKLSAEQVHKIKINILRGKILVAEAAEDWMGAYRLACKIRDMMGEEEDTFNIRVAKTYYYATKAEAAAGPLGRIALRTGFFPIYDGISWEVVENLLIMKAKDGIIKLTTNGSIISQLFTKGVFNKEIKEKAKERKSFNRIFDEIVGNLIKTAIRKGNIPVSWEFESHLTDSDEMTARAVELAKIVDEPLMTNKVPAIGEVNGSGVYEGPGIEAIEKMIAAGLKPNITLVFCSRAQIKAIAGAVARGLNARIDNLKKEGKSEEDIVKEMVEFRSYISYFVSRIPSVGLYDDEQIAARIEKADTKEEKWQLAKDFMDLSCAFYIDAQKMFEEELMANGFGRAKEYGCDITLELDASTGDKPLAHNCKVVKALTTGKGAISIKELSKFMLLKRGVDANATEEEKEEAKALSKQYEANYENWGYFVMRLARANSSDTIPGGVYNRMAKGEGNEEIEPMEYEEAKALLIKAESEFGLTNERWEKLGASLLKKGLKGFITDEQKLKVKIAHEVVNILMEDGEGDAAASMYALKELAALKKQIRDIEAEHGKKLGMDLSGLVKEVDEMMRQVAEKANIELDKLKEDLADESPFVASFEAGTPKDSGNIISDSRANSIVLNAILDDGVRPEFIDPHHSNNYEMQREQIKLGEAGDITVTCIRTSWNEIYVNYSNKDNRNTWNRAVEFPEDFGRCVDIKLVKGQHPMDANIMAANEEGDKYLFFISADYTRLPEIKQRKWIKGKSGKNADTSVDPLEKQADEIIEQIDNALNAVAAYVAAYEEAVLLNNKEKIEATKPAALEAINILTGFVEKGYFVAGSINNNINKLARVLREVKGVTDAPKLSFAFVDVASNFRLEGIRGLRRHEIAHQLAVLAQKNGGTAQYLPGQPEHKSEQVTAADKYIKEVNKALDDMAQYVALVRKNKIDFDGKTTTTKEVIKRTALKQACDNEGFAIYEDGDVAAAAKKMLSPRDAYSAIWDLAREPFTAENLTVPYAQEQMARYIANRFSMIENIIKYGYEMSGNAFVTGAHTEWDLNQIEKYTGEIREKIEVLAAMNRGLGEVIAETPYTQGETPDTVVANIKEALSDIKAFLDSIYGADIRGFYDRRTSDTATFKVTDEKLQEKAVKAAEALKAYSEKGYFNIEDMSDIDRAVFELSSLLGMKEKQYSVATMSWLAAPYLHLNKALLDKDKDKGIDVIKAAVAVQAQATAFKQMNKQIMEAGQVFVNRKQALKEYFDGNLPRVLPVIHAPKDSLLQKFHLAVLSGMDDYVEALREREGAAAETICKKLEEQTAFMQEKYRIFEAFETVYSQAVETVGSAEDIDSMEFFRVYSRALMELHTYKAGWIMHIQKQRRIYGSEFSDEESIRIYLKNLFKEYINRRVARSAGDADDVIIKVEAMLLLGSDDGPKAFDEALGEIRTGSIVKSGVIADKYIPVDMSKARDININAYAGTKVIYNKTTPDPLGVRDVGRSISFIENEEDALKALKSPRTYDIVVLDCAVTEGVVARLVQSEACYVVLLEGEATSESSLHALKVLTDKGFSHSKVIMSIPREGKVEWGLRVCEQFTGSVFTSNDMSVLNLPVHDAVESSFRGVGIKMECDWLLGYFQKTEYSEKRDSAISDVIKIREKIKYMINKEAYPGMYKQLAGYLDAAEEILRDNEKSLNDAQREAFNEHITNVKNIFKDWTTVFQVGLAKPFKLNTIKWLLHKMKYFVHSEKDFYIRVFDKDWNSVLMPREDLLDAVWEDRVEVFENWSVDPKAVEAPVMRVTAEAGDADAAEEEVDFAAAVERSRVLISGIRAFLDKIGKNVSKGDIWSPADRGWIERTVYELSEKDSDCMKAAEDAEELVRITRSIKNIPGWVNVAEVSGRLRNGITRIKFYNSVNGEVKNIVTGYMAEDVKSMLGSLTALKDSFADAYKQKDDMQKLAYVNSLAAQAQETGENLTSTLQALQDEGVIEYADRQTDTSVDPFEDMADEIMEKINDALDELDEYLQALEDDEVSAEAEEAEDALKNVDLLSGYSKEGYFFNPDVEDSIEGLKDVLIALSMGEADTDEAFELLGVITDYCENNDERRNDIVVHLAVIAQKGTTAQHLPNQPEQLSGRPAELVQKLWHTEHPKDGIKIIAQAYGFTVEQVSRIYMRTLRQEHPTSGFQRYGHIFTYINGELGEQMWSRWTEKYGIGLSYKELLNIHYDNSWSEDTITREGFDEFVIWAGAQQIGKFSDEINETDFWNSSFHIALINAVEAELDRISMEQQQLRPYETDDSISMGDNDDKMEFNKDIQTSEKGPDLSAKDIARIKEGHTADYGNPKYIAEQMEKDEFKKYLGNELVRLMQINDWKKRHMDTFTALEKQAQKKFGSKDGEVLFKEMSEEIRQAVTVSKYSRMVTAAATDRADMGWIGNIKQSINTPMETAGVNVRVVTTAEILLSDNTMGDMLTYAVELGDKFVVAVNGEQEAKEIRKMAPYALIINKDSIGQFITDNPASVSLVLADRDFSKAFRTQAGTQQADNRFFYREVYSQKGQMVVYYDLFKSLERQLKEIKKAFKAGTDIKKEEMKNRLQKICDYLDANIKQPVFTPITETLRNTLEALVDAGGFV